ncbi:carbamoyltransferase HypF [Gordonibacter sp.]|uniref:carbamoyltransferase HypF n=1 Tax=Gordonibacter sp. TaxID=1968902 RepID=UPI002FCB8CCF
MIEALDIQVKGIVQGVGFRPFVYRLAKKYLINGWVLNAADGVFIHAEGEGKLLDEFVLELSDNPPAASRVEEVTLKEVPLENFDTFDIRFSDAGAVDKTTLVSPDLATCDDCAWELFNPNDRRYRYPFINCTNCGPRFTIIEKLPYDRKSTSMKDFPMCERCAAEYGDPLDRRFHAQPDACFVCGPHVSWCEHEDGDSEAPLGPVTWGRTREESDTILTRAVELLLAGKIVAVKGLGGFHLVCDAGNAEALALLRARKRRRGKAFAVMASDVAAVRRLCAVSEVEEGVLTSAQRPIVLLRKHDDAPFAPGLADELPELGVMLPYTPLQHLLLHDFSKELAARFPLRTRTRGGGKGDSAVGEVPLLVMTSGNLHDEPIVTDDAEASVKLFGVADGFLGHDRAIRARYDDSVVRVIRAGSTGEAVQFIRRARGYAPLPLSLPKWTPATDGGGAAVGPGADGTAVAPPFIFATGPEQKNTFALTRDGEAFVSQHIGDLENAETYDAWLAAKDRYEALFEICPTRVACDLHPEYLTTKWAHDQELPVVEVQHHFAHVVSAMAEHQLSGPVCGIAFDGTGYGADGALWGGEVLLANLSAFERFANLAYLPMPGGAAAVKHPLRMAYGALWAFDLLDHPGAHNMLAALGEQADICEQMIDRGLNTPLTSSAGRLFDAASALLGICVEPTYEGEPAILLEAAIGAFAEQDDYDSAAERYAIAVTKNTATAASTAQDTSVVLLDAAGTFRALLDDFAAGVPVSLVARRFHDAFVQAIVDISLLVRGVYDIETVVLTGGVFMNRYLVEHALAALEVAGFTVAVNRDLPPNDGCISFGQAVVAWAASKENAANAGV